MASNLRISSGSIFAGNPITISCSAATIKDPTFHRVVFEVTVNGHTFKFSQPVLTEGGSIQIDISSAIRATFDDYEWSPDTTTPPSRSWSVKAYDEYMKDGELQPPYGIVTLSGLPTYYGGFNDLERITSGGSKTTTRYSRKPSSSPEIVCVGDTICVPVTGSTPSSMIVSIVDAGKHATYNVVAITPRSVAQQRHQIRFINAFGCLESISVPRAYQKKANFQFKDYAITKTQSFANPAHTITKKQDSPEVWRFSSGLLADEQWLQWYLHDFFMVEHAWLNVNGTWLRVHILPEEEITYLDNDKRETHELIFQARFDINGSPTLKL